MTGRRARLDGRAAARVINGAAERQRDMDVDIIGNLDLISRRARRAPTSRMAPCSDCIVYWNGALQSTVNANLPEPALLGSPASIITLVTLLEQAGATLPVTSICTLSTAAKSTATGNIIPPSAAAITAALAQKRPKIIVCPTHKYEICSSRRPAEYQPNPASSCMPCKVVSSLQNFNLTLVTSNSFAEFPQPHFCVCDKSDISLWIFLLKMRRNNSVKSIVLIQTDYEVNSVSGTQRPRDAYTVVDTANPSTTDSCRGFGGPDRRPSSRG